MTNNDMPGSKPLKNPKRERFCHEYIIDLNGKQAAMRAKYSVKTAESQGSRMLGYAKVQERIAFLTKNKTDEIDISVDRILRELSYMATSNVADMLGKKGLTFKNISELPESVQRTIKSLEYDERTGKLRYTVHSKGRALELLGKYHSLWIERLKIDADVVHEISEQFAPKIPKKKVDKKS